MTRLPPSSLTVDVGLCLEDAEDAVNALNRLEIACRRKARKVVDLPTRQELPLLRVISPTPARVGTAPPGRRKRRNEGAFGRPHCDICARNKWVRAPLRSERGHAIIAKHGRRTVRGLPEEGGVFCEGSTICWTS